MSKCCPMRYNPEKSVDLSDEHAIRNGSRNQTVHPRVSYDAEWKVRSLVMHVRKQPSGTDTIFSPRKLTSPGLIVVIQAQRLWVHPALLCGLMYSNGKI